MKTPPFEARRLPFGEVLEDLGARSIAMFSRVLRATPHVRHFASKPKCVMLNAARLDFDGRMNWSKVTEADGNSADFSRFYHVLDGFIWILREFSQLLRSFEA